GITPAVIAPGAEHTCAVLRDGTVRCWGDNTWGQLGNGSSDFTSTTPSGPVTGIATAIAASSGAEHTCALLQDGTVRCWGRNDDGRLGVATNANGTRPCPQSPSCAFTPVTVDGLGGGVTWTSSNTAVATIDANGLATGRGAGSTTITAASAGRSGSTTLTVVTRPTLTVIPEGTGRGTVTSNPAGINCGATCSAAFDSGTQVTLTATPAGGSTFQGWTGGGCASTNPCTLTLTANTTVVANFARPRFTLSVSPQGTGSGTVTSSPTGINCGATCSASFASGTQVTLTATPASGSTFDGWTGGGCASTNPCTLTLTANTTVTARFSVRRVTLSVFRQGLGSGTVASSPAGIDCGATCSATYDSGTVVTLTATPGLLSAFVGWSGGCSGTGPCTVTLTGNTSVTATFRLLGLL
ncbi:MAG TPA: Ig-like domain-containing protein, partial [Actinomycetota bacterium]|nr:Ig-like domain-containing protein [Actinomycetota bacterium]